MADKPSKEKKVEELREDKTEQELRENITQTILHSNLHSGLIFDDGVSDEEAYYLADQILALTKEAGYVKLAEDQKLPVHFATRDGKREKWLREAGWRKIEVEVKDAESLK